MTVLNPHNLEQLHNNFVVNNKSKTNVSLKKIPFCIKVEGAQVMLVASAGV